MLLAGVAFMLLCTAPAQAQTVKPPLHGLISMGAYRFVGKGGQPVNTLAPIRAKSGIFGGIVVVASWQQLQPTRGGVLPQSNVIDKALAEIRTYNLNHPNKPLGVRLRVWGGFMAPDWAKSIGGPPITATHNGKVRTVGGFWRPSYRMAWADLQAQLAARYDDEPLIQEVAVTQCMSFTAEPFFVPTEATVMPVLRAAGFTDAAYRNCLSTAVADYGPWQQTRLILAVNPYRTTQGAGAGDAAFTKKVMQACRTEIGARCVLDNHDLNSPLTSSIVPIYNYMRTLGPEIVFQTFNMTPADFPGTIKLGVQYGASAIELWQDYGGFPLVPSSQLRQWARWIEKNPGELLPADEAE